MCVDGYLEAENYGRWTTYKIKPKVATLDTNLATSGGKVATLSRRVDTSTCKVASLRDRNLATRLAIAELEKLFMQICINDYQKMEYVV